MPHYVSWAWGKPSSSSATTASLTGTALDARPEQILRWFVLRWQMETTFQESRRHLGVETQRQWSELAIRRTTPALLGLFSLITPFAHPQMACTSVEAVRRVAWYCKPCPTFSDALALVRQELWAHATFRRSPREPETVEVPRAFVEHLTDTLCYAA